MIIHHKRLYLTLTAIALFSWGLVQLINTNEIAQRVNPAHSADYFSTGYTKFEMNEQGKVKSKLIADSVTHYSDDNTSHTVHPVIFFYNDTTPPWVINAESGILSADGKNLALNGKTVINRARAEGVKQLTINTANLKVNPDTHYAETTARAELLSPPNVTTGTGMKMVFSSPIHLELLANVKGKYETH